MSEKQFYTRLEAAALCGIQVRQFKRLTLQYGIEAMRFPVERTTGGAPFRHFYTPQQIGQVQKRQQSDIKEFTPEPTVRVVELHEIEGFERVCVHCPHPQRKGGYVCCQCKKPVSQKELRNVSSIAFA